MSGLGNNLNELKIHIKNAKEELEQIDKTNLISACEECTKQLEDLAVSLP